eukprot:g44393.t1
MHRMAASPGSQSQQQMRLLMVTGGSGRGSNRDVLLAFGTGAAAKLVIRGSSGRLFKMARRHLEEKPEASGCGRSRLGAPDVCKQSRRGMPRAGTSGVTEPVAAAELEPPGCGVNMCLVQDPPSAVVSAVKRWHLKIGDSNVEGG